MTVESTTDLTKHSEYYEKLSGNLVFLLNDGGENGKRVTDVVGCQDSSAF